MLISEALPGLPTNVTRHTLHVLTGLLPPPLTDMPEEWAARDEAAIAAIAALHPADAFEALLAARIVGANSYGLDCLRQAGMCARDRAAGDKCRAQAALMTRQADAAMRFLERRQKSRAKTEVAPVAEPHPVAPLSGIEAEADQYALDHRKRATLIRRLGRMPEKVDWGSLKPELVRQIVTGATPILRSRDIRQRSPGLALAA